MISKQFAKVVNSCRAFMNCKHKILTKSDRKRGLKHKNVEYRERFLYGGYSKTWSYLYNVLPLEQKPIMTEKFVIKCGFNQVKIPDIQMYRCIGYHLFACNKKINIFKNKCAIISFFCTYMHMLIIILLIMV